MEVDYIKHILAVMVIGFVLIFVFIFMNTGDESTEIKQHILGCALFSFVAVLLVGLVGIAMPFLKI